MSNCDEGLSACYCSKTKLEFIFFHETKTHSVNKYNEVNFGGKQKLECHMSFNKASSC